MANVRNGVQASETRAKISSTDSKMVHEGELSVERCVPSQSVTSPTLAVSSVRNLPECPGLRNDDVRKPLGGRAHSRPCGVTSPHSRRRSASRAAQFERTIAFD